MTKGKPPRERSPQEKKALSLDRDCRNNYGENDKASRKLIPLRKAQSKRKSRRQVAQSLQGVDRQDDVTVDLVQSDAISDINRLGRWQKAPDAPLSSIIPQQLKARRLRPGFNKARRVGLPVVWPPQEGDE